MSNINDCFAVHSLGQVRGIDIGGELNLNTCLPQPRHANVGSVRRPVRAVGRVIGAPRQTVAFVNGGEIRGSELKAARAKCARAPTYEKNVT